MGFLNIIEEFNFVIDIKNVETSAGYSAHLRHILTALALTFDPNRIQRPARTRRRPRLHFGRQSLLCEDTVSLRWRYSEGIDKNWAELPAI